MSDRSFIFSYFKVVLCVFFVLCNNLTAMLDEIISFNLNNFIFIVLQSETARHTKTVQSGSSLNM